MRKLVLIGGVAALVGWLAVACSSGNETSPTGKGGTGQGGGSGGSSASGGKGGGTGGSTTGGTAGTGTGCSGGKGGTAGGNTGGTSTEGGAAGEDGQGGMQACATETQEAKLTPANLLFVIDKSGSMQCNPPNGDDVLGAMCENFPRKENPAEDSKWEVTRDALSDALDTLAMQPADISAGISVFPKGTTSNSCAVEEVPEVAVSPLSATQRTAMRDLMDSVVPGGLTPIAGATILSYSHLSKLIRTGDLVGNTFVVLLTDGAETCADSYLEELVETHVPNARLFNIRTFVIGAPGSEGARRLLSQIAFEGGTARTANCDHESADGDVGDCHFDMTTSENFAEDLNDALLAISRTKVLACEFDVPTNPDGGGVDLDEVNVTFRPGDGEPEQVLNDPDTDCADAEGWQYSEDGRKIILCGSICDRVQADPEGQVSIVLGCPTIQVT